MPQIVYVNKKPKVTVNCMVTPEQYEALARKAIREGYKTGEKSGVGKMLNELVGEIADEDIKLHFRPENFHSADGMTF